MCQTSYSALYTSNLISSSWLPREEPVLFLQHPASQMSRWGSVRVSNMAKIARVPCPCWSGILKLDAAGSNRWCRGKMGQENAKERREDGEECQCVSLVEVGKWCSRFWNGSDISVLLQGSREPSGKEVTNWQRRGKLGRRERREKDETLERFGRCTSHTHWLDRFSC